ncbi:MAG: phosphoribosylformylglycinamidine synthase subunit PurS [bacterium]|nr:phosphoribosylformylglycinamidine synthase subunit PurS [bacterium]
MYLARIYIKLKESILDPQGQAVIHALHNLEHKEVADVRVGKYIEVRVDEADKGAAEQKVRVYCDKLLANPVIETFDFELEPVQ